VARVRSDWASEDFLADPSSFDNVDYEDPKAMAQWARRVGEASGVDMGSDYEEMLEHMERGDDPGDVPGGDDLGFGNSDL